MSSDEMGSLVLTLSILIASAHVLGYVFERLWQPRLVGEILAGVLLGPFTLGQLAPSLSSRIFGDLAFGSGKTEVVLNFIYWIGLFLLMFISGSETRRLMARENQRETAWLVGIGTPLPFLLVLGLPLGAFLSPDLIVGKAGQATSALLVLAIAVAVTSIPVLSRIFHDLKILHTRFASLILGSAVLEDIILWAVLAIATSLANTISPAKQYGIHDIAAHIAATAAYMSIGLIAAPRILKHVHHTRWNLLVKASPVGYLFVVLFIYAAVASMLGVNLIFASFLAGFGLVGGVAGTERARFSDSLESIARVSFGVFIPIYFAVVGYKLVLGRDFSLPMLLMFLTVSSVLKLLSVGLAAKLAGFRSLDIVNLAITTNARGGPGIVLASVAFDAGIINAQFYTTLVLTAVITSQAAGAWLKFVLSRGWPLLSTNPTESWHKPEPAFAAELERPQKNVA
jgi:Kef-type K+ transport system membrane component KefB